MKTYLAPMAGISHSAFRRLIASFGADSYTGLFTEMIPGRLLLNKTVESDPATKRRPEEGPVIYQLLLTGEEDPGRIIEKILPLSPSGIDLNAACPAPAVKKLGSGFEVFMDPDRVFRILSGLRRHWSGSLSVKCRLGETAGVWRPAFRDFVSACEDSGADFLTLHGRFADEKLKSVVRRDLMDEARSMTRLPVVANGDIHTIEKTAFPGFAGIMLGRAVVCCPWIFRLSADPTFIPDYLDAWERFVGFVKEDFESEKILPALKAFGVYFARNFFFGQVLYGKIQSAAEPVKLDENVRDFLSSSPQTVRQPDFSGL
jgi:tRNA-dihydrouridine synthase